MCELNCCVLHLRRGKTADNVGIWIIFRFLLGMELFDEALRKWEQALNIRHQPHSTSSNNSLALQGATCGDVTTVTIKLLLPVCGGIASH